MELLKRHRIGWSPELEQAKKEVVQHTLAWLYIYNELVVLDKPLTENLILETHKILTNGVLSHDGVESARYSGIYKAESVTVGFSKFINHENVPTTMRTLTKEFNNDISQVHENGTIDPFWVASKYCHKFAHIHPFLDGNGRMHRLLLNAILMNYVGIVVTLGVSKRKNLGQGKSFEVMDWEAKFGKEAFGDQPTQDEEIEESYHCGQGKYE